MLIMFVDIAFVNPRACEHGDCEQVNPFSHEAPEVGFMKWSMARRLFEALQDMSVLL